MAREEKQTQSLIAAYKARLEAVIDVSLIVSDK